MKCIAGLFFSVLILLIAADIQADIYTWTDKNGVKRYSDRAPDESAAKVEVQEEVPSRLTEEKTADIPDAELERAIRELEPGSQSKDDKIKKGDETKSQESKITVSKASAVPSELEQRVQAEKERLQSEIDRIEQLAVGPSLSLALKQAMIKEYKDKLAALEKSPEEYFRTDQQ